MTARSSTRGGRLLLAGALLAALAGPSLAGQEDTLIPIEKYDTIKGKSLASVYKTRLLQFSEQIYHCLPWISVVPNGLGFRRAKDAQADDRYLSTWIQVDQKEDAAFAALSQDQRVSAMFSRYGVDLLKRMTALTGVVGDADVAGFSVVLSWLKPGTVQPGRPAVSETLALFIDKTTLLDFLANRVPADEFTNRARFTVFDGTSPIGRVALDVWEDSFNSTYKLANYDPPQGARCR